jgi:hypothetical protein
VDDVHLGISLAASTTRTGEARARMLSPPSQGASDRNALPEQISACGAYYTFELVGRCSMHQRFNAPLENCVCSRGPCHDISNRSDGAAAITSSVGFR